MQELQGLTKQEVVDKIDGQTSWTSRQLRTMISGMRSNRNYLDTDKVRIGDVYYHQGLSHPAVVISKFGDSSYLSILMTTKGENESVISKSKSRFFRDSFLTITSSISSKESILENIIGIYNNKSHLRKVTKKFKDILNSRL